MDANNKKKILEEHIARVKGMINRGRSEIESLKKDIQESTERIERREKGAEEDAYLLSVYEAEYAKLILFGDCKVLNFKFKTNPSPEDAA